MTFHINYTQSPIPVHNTFKHRKGLLKLYSSNKNLVYVACDHGSVLLWQCCDTLCSFVFMADIMFS